MIEVLGHRVLIKPMPVEEITKGGIILTVDKKKEILASTKGTILAVGPQAWVAFSKNRDNSEPWAAVGDTVLIAKYAGKVLQDPETGEEVIVCNDEDVLLRIK